MPQQLINSPEQFDQFIPQILAQVPATKLLYLHGHLGAGKTTFVKQVSKYLGVNNTIVSPTFVYIREYTTANSKKLLHLDLYRFEGNIDDLFSAIDLEEVALICIEWSERVPALASRPHLDLTLSYHDENSRNLVW